MTTIWTMFCDFVGTGWLHWIMAMCVCIYEFVSKQNHKGKLTYASIIVLLVFFNPIIYETIGIRFMSGMYWRMLWIIPVYVLIAHGGVMLYEHLKKMWQKGLSILVVVFLIIIGGKPMITKGNFNISQNLYQIPQVTIDVADAMIAHDYGEWAVVPEEMLCSMRQYTTKIKLLYGRNAYGYILEMEDLHAIIHDEMVKENPDVEILAKNLRDRKIDYVVFNGQYHKGFEDIEKYGCKHIDSVDGYEIYLVE